MGLAVAPALSDFGEMIDLATLLKSVSQDTPCGENLEYDPAFGELERAAQGTPAHEMGGSTIAAVAPDWGDVYEKAVGLFDRTKDLRVAVLLAHAALKKEGLPGVASGLALIRSLLSDYWDTLYPELDTDDNDDPTLRMNTLLALNNRAEFVASLSRCPLIESRTMGRVSQRGIGIASGEIAPGEEDGPEPLGQAQIDAAFLEGDLEQLKANAAAAHDALSELDALNALLAERAGLAAPDLGTLEAELRAIDAVLAEHLKRRLGNGADGSAAAGGASAGGQPAAAGEVRSREDVIRLLDRICEYFERNEPSSPIPLLLRRAKGLVAKEFIEILRDLTPDGVSQAELIGGLHKED